MLRNMIDDPQESNVGQIVVECNDSLALLEHRNRIVNNTRKELVTIKIWWSVCMCTDCI